MTSAPTAMDVAVCRGGYSTWWATPALAALAAVVLPTAQCRAAQCAPVEPQVVVHVLSQEVRYDDTQDLAGIRAVAAQEGALDADSVIRGLTATQLSWRAAISVLGIPVEGGVCVQPATLDISVGYAKPSVVYVASIYPAGGCEHTAILEHEDNHVRIQRETLQQHAPMILAAAQAAVHDQRYPLFAKDIEAGKQVISQWVHEAIDVEVDNMMQDQRAQHAYLDRPESIEYTARRCTHW